MEPIHRPPQRHRRHHKSRHHSRINGELDESTDKNGKSDGVVLSKKIGKHAMQKKIDKLIEENRMLTMKLERSAANSGEFSLSFSTMIAIKQKHDRFLEDNKTVLVMQKT